MNGSQIYLQNIVELKLKVMSEISSKVVEIIKDRLNVAEKDIELTSSFANDLGADRGGTGASAAGSAINQ